MVLPPIPPAFSAHCWNCWKTASHRAQHCPEPKRTIAERDTIRIKLGIGISAPTPATRTAPASNAPENSNAAGNNNKDDAHDNRSNDSKPDEKKNGDKLLCWNCWDDRHRDGKCPKPRLTISARESLRLRLNAPKPQDEHYDVLLAGVRCVNCWVSTSHMAYDCPETRLTTFGREKLRVEWGVPLHDTWRRELEREGVEPLDVDTRAIGMKVSESAAAGEKSGDKGDVVSPAKKRDTGGEAADSKVGTYNRGNRNNKTLCWNCWEESHVGSNFKCPKAPLPTSQRELLRIELGVPKPKEEEYGRRLAGVLCMNCWKSVAHSAYHCTERKRTTEERDEIRRGLGIPLSHGWKAILEREGKLQTCGDVQRKKEGTIVQNGNNTKHDIDGNAANAKAAVGTPSVHTQHENKKANTATQNWKATETKPNAPTVDGNATNVKTATAVTTLRGQLENFTSARKPETAIRHGKSTQTKSNTAPPNGNITSTKTPVAVRQHREHKPDTNGNDSVKPVTSEEIAETVNHVYKTTLRAVKNFNNSLADFKDYMNNLIEMQREQNALMAERYELEKEDMEIKEEPGVKADVDRKKEPGVGVDVEKKQSVEKMEEIIGAAAGNVRCGLRKYGI